MLGHLRLRMQLPVTWSGDITQVAASEKDKLWRADGKLAPVAIATSRPNGSLLLDPAWKKEFPTKPGVYLMKDVQWAGYLCWESEMSERSPLIVL